MNHRDRLLGYLKARQGRWVSGTWLSGELGVSRNAVSKHIRRLRVTGYPITTAPRKGYRLEGVPDLLEPAEIRDGLDTTILGRGEIHCLGLTDSTNRQAKILAQKGAPEGTLVLADRQTQGRGRMGRSWDSPRGGIFLSLVLRPALPPFEAPAITLVAGVAASETLVHLTGLEARIKWPNDILIKDRKIAGILTEISSEMDAIDHVVMGIGINVNLTADDLAPEVRPLATSVCIGAGREFSRVALIQEFLKRFDRDYARLQSESFSAVRQRWKALTDIIGRRVRVEMIGRVCEGVVADVDQEGGLILEDKAGDLCRVISGDVVYV
jgi:BirA family biotin operon repressor/biotin-[acetyl-CoA-carboxylase] ligase